MEVWNSLSKQGLSRFFPGPARNTGHSLFSSTLRYEGVEVRIMSPISPVTNHLSFFTYFHTRRCESVVSIGVLFTNYGESVKKLDKVKKMSQLVPKHA